MSSPMRWMTHPFFYVLAIINLMIVGVTLGTSQQVRAVSECTPGVLRVLGQDPSRPHRVAQGASTTFILAVEGNQAATLFGRASITQRSNGWLTGLSYVDDNFQTIGTISSTLRFGVPVSTTRYLAVSLVPNKRLAEGDVGTVEIQVGLTNNTTGCVQVSAKVANRPKIYYVIPDGLSPGYALLNRRGDYWKAGDELLMPNTVRHLQKSRWFPDARNSLPSATDMNIYNILSGSWPGTSGISSVGMAFVGWDANGDPVTQQMNKGMLRWGAEGKIARTIFDVAKDPAYGGESDTFNAIISGKPWLLVHYYDELNTVPLIVAPTNRPSYMPEPLPYRLGDPPSDPDAPSDRDGTNLSPGDQFKMILEGVSMSGDKPLNAPDDRWVMTNALRMIAVEDPDVFAIHMGDVDIVQHGSGSADQPSEWVDVNNTPDVLWDDISYFNLRANRDPVLDVVHEADANFGSLIRSLTKRGVYDQAYVVLASDHSLTTLVDESQAIDLEAFLTEQKVMDTIRYLPTSGSITKIYLWDSAQAPMLEDLLETYTTTHPISGEVVHPFLVINRAEMDSGIDGRTGAFGRDGGPKRGELYSQWNIDLPVENNTKVVWPDLFLVTNDRLRLKLGYMAFIGGHEGLGTRGAMIALYGPTIQPARITNTDASLADITPTLYQLLQLSPPGNVDGQSLLDPLPPPLVASPMLRQTFAPFITQTYLPTLAR